MIYGFHATYLHIFGLIGRVSARRWFLAHFWTELGLWPVPDSNESSKIFNFGHDGTFLIRNSVPAMVQMIKSSFESLSFEAYVASRPVKVKKY
jgi:hypothetical protein